MTQFLIYDVFTERAYAGNPLAVVPEAAELPEVDLQRIAREFNFSETVFLYPPDDPEHTARVRIFTPSREIPFAGHPTIGSAIALRDLGCAGDLVLELGVGPIPCRMSAGGAEFETRVPLTIGPEINVDVAADCLSLAPADIETTIHAPVVASVGLPFVMVEIPSRSALAQATGDPAAFRRGAETTGISEHFDLFFYVREGNRLTTRMFAPLDGIPEDPATGSASAALTALLATIEGRGLKLEMHQGIDMGRPSEIRTEAVWGTDGVEAVRVGGNAVRVMSGRIQS